MTAPLVQVPARTTASESDTPGRAALTRDLMRGDTVCLAADVQRLSFAVPDDARSAGIARQSTYGVWREIRAIV